MPESARDTPETTRIEDAAEPATATLPPARWSGAAPIPATEPRRSVWSRLRDKVAGPAPDFDDRTAVPAVDPWADQTEEHTPVWPEAPAPAVDMPPTRVVIPAAQEAKEKAREVKEKALKAAAEALKAARTEKKTAIPSPGTYPPPPAGTGLPPRAPAKPRWWKESPAPQKRAPVQPRPPMPPPLSRPRPRRRRWLRRLTTSSALALVLCCGAPLAYWQFPAVRQFPVSAVLPPSFSDLELRDNGRQAAERLAEQLSAAGATGDAFAGVYGDGNGKRVTLFGVTGWRFTPGSDVEEQLASLSGDLKLKNIVVYDSGDAGVHESCGIGRLDGSAVVVCAWADHGSMATAVLTRRSIDESAELVARLRTEVLTPKYLPRFLTDQI
ncbi:MULTISPECIES: hypothetical protein [Actinoplanes]|uniref:hypothetical protein n=1 Tax=Actinoplanes TaxID=1865 RepID=UPI0012F89BB8|nr:MULTISPECIES: hypothetical protein [Actinoplanes]